MGKKLSYNRRLIKRKVAFPQVTSAWLNCKSDIISIPYEAKFFPEDDTVLAKHIVYTNINA